VAKNLEVLAFLWAEHCSGAHGFGNPAQSAREAPVEIFQDQVNDRMMRRNIALV
jgi:hypothetical protein